LSVKDAEMKKAHQDKNQMLFYRLFKGKLILFYIGHRSLFSGYLNNNDHRKQACISDHKLRYLLCHAQYYTYTINVVFRVS